MRVELFDFSLPEERIATSPASPRDAARLLYISCELQDRHIPDLPALLSPGDLLVFNDTKVIPARLHGKRGEARVEVTLLKECSEFGVQSSEKKLSQNSELRTLTTTTWQAFAKPAKRLRVGDTVTFAEDFHAEVLAKHEGEVTLRFNMAGAEFERLLAEYGTLPLPPYIASRRAPGEVDKADYQTIYAREPGAVAAPTAGLHFTDRLMEALAARGVAHAFVTLHVGAGTFLPVKTEDTREHKMHSEWYSIGEETAGAINRTRAAGGKIVAVGTTSLRVLESIADAEGRVRAGRGDTEIFITPGYNFKCVDRLLTNFHLPRSTLFMLVCAFAGTERMQAAYAHAIAQGYRFYSYGDACLLER